MQNPEFIAVPALVVIVRLFAILGCLLVAAYQISKGHDIYKDGKSEKERGSIQWGKLKITTSSSGAIITALATFWIVPVLFLNPVYKNDGQNINIAAGFTQQAVWSSYPVKIAGVAQMQQGPDLLKAFATAVASGEARPVTVEVNGKQKKPAIKDIELQMTSTGKSYVILAAEVPGVEEPKELMFKPVYNDSTLTFEPCSESACKQ